MIDGLISLSGKAPNGVMSVGNAATAGKNRPVDLLANIQVTKIAVGRIPMRPRIDGMIFVIGLQIQRGFRRTHCVIPSDPIPYRNIMTAAVTALHTVYR